MNVLYLSELRVDTKKSERVDVSHYVIETRHVQVFKSFKHNEWVGETYQLGPLGSNYQYKTPDDYFEQILALNRNEGIRSEILEITLRTVPNAVIHMLIGK